MKIIRSFRHKGLKRLYERDDASRIGAQYLRRVENYLSVLDAAVAPEDLDLPGAGFHRLRGDLKDCYAVSVSGNWRLIFRFTDAPEDVDLVDYH